MVMYPGIQTIGQQKKPGLLLVAIPDLGIHCKELDFRISKGEGSYTNADYA